MLCRANIISKLLYHDGVESAETVQSSVIPDIDLIKMIKCVSLRGTPLQNKVRTFFYLGRKAP